LAASASEFIVRITAWAAHLGLRHAVLPRHAYGDYARAARVWGLACVPACDGPALHWSCEPSSPLGTVDAGLCRRASAGSLRVLDCAYAPLRLEGQATPPPPAAWQLWSPNKALGLTGVRAAYAVAPDEEQATAVAALAPSWPLGADGVALLEAWVGAQNWLAGTRERLRRWKARQLALCRSLGWDVVPGSLANFFTARPAVADLAAALHALRGQGIKLRDTASFGLPGYVRLGVRPPASQQALRRAWLALPGHGTPSSSPVVPVATSLSSSPS
jgi:histidinol-phosphate aminotransferase